MMSIADLAVPSFLAENVTRFRRLKLGLFNLLRVDVNE